MAEGLRETMIVPLDERCLDTYAAGRQAQSTRSRITTGESCKQKPEEPQLRTKSLLSMPKCR